MGFLLVNVANYKATREQQKIGIFEDSKICYKLVKLTKWLGAGALVSDETNRLAPNIPA